MRDRFCPECRWTVVTDAAGRRRLEMRWVPLGVAASVEQQLVRAA